jgi:hypothetical protein
MRDFWKTLLSFFTSLQVTVVLLVMSIILIFVATIDQVNLGIWAVQAKYFRSFLVFYPIPGTQLSIPIFPGGYLVGGMLLLNLIAVHVYRFRFSWRRLGIILAHAGIVLLLAGEITSGILQKEYLLQFRQGETKNYAESFRGHELAIADVSDPSFDQIVAIPESRLHTGQSIQTPKLPFRILVKEYYANSMLQMRNPEQSPGSVPSGMASQVSALELPLTYKADEQNLPSAIIELLGPEGSLGTFLVSAQLDAAQGLSVGNKRYTLALRLTREYMPFSLTLLELRHELYPGSDIPRNFSSRVRLGSENGRDDREVLIFMNNPLRHGGLTFYQHQMNGAERFSALQVVRNPGWVFPYVSSLLLFGGMLLHFVINLVSYIRRRSLQAAGTTCQAS